MSSRKLFFSSVIASFAILMPLAAQRTLNPGYTKHEKAAYLAEDLVNFIRPGVIVKIGSAAIAKGVTITDPKGMALDRLGVSTPGPVSMSLIAACIPAGKTQYVSYTTTVAKPTIPGNTNPSQTQAANDSGGTWATNAVGDYTYTFKTKAPTTFDPTVTHSIGVSATRDLSEFITQDEWASVGNDVFNFVP